MSTCAGNHIVAGPTAVFTKKSNVDGNRLSFVMTGWVPTTFNKLRISVEMINNSGDAYIIGMYQTSNDGVGVINTYDFGNARTTDGWTPNAFTDVTANLDGVVYVRFGVRVRNATGSALEACLAAIRVDWK